tara:strand:+ start:4523 stop:5119 length:597 start_codon:yes stop_codon:yes gene_type:complete
MGRIVVLDNGHGGMIGGDYQTMGKRSPKWASGTMYEGMFNRWVVNRIIEKLDRKEIPYFHISPELTDVSLGARVSRANAFDQGNDIWLLSIHANAGGGHGVEGFTTKGVTKSDDLGEIVLQNIKDIGINTMRIDSSDGDLDKEVNFYMLRNPRCPAFLLECGFMDNRVDYDNLWDEGYLSMLVDSLVKSIEIIYKQNL